MNRARSRTLYAAGLLVGAIAVLLVAWFLSGWADVRAQQRELRAQPVREAELKAATLSAELRGELARLISREAERPYFHYQNLFHDPRTGASYYVSPSPLAAGPQDPMVLGYFQLDGSGKLSTPTINDDVPHLSEQSRLAENRQFRDEITRGFAMQLKSIELEGASDAVDRGPLVAEVAPTKVLPTTKQRQEPAIQEKVVQLDQQSYEQNAAPTEIYWNNYVGNAPPPQRRNLPQQAEGNLQRRQVDPQEQPQRATAPRVNPEEALPQQEVTPAPTDVPPRLAPKPKPKPKPVPTPEPVPDAVDKPVTITISPLEWRTYPYAGALALVAVRDVTTPDGKIAQGFVIDRSTLTGWLASRAGDAVAELTARDGGGTNEIAPGWHLSVAANPHALGDAAVTASKVAATFLLRFVVIGLLAAAAAMLAVMLVSRAERLARERSQFAAAAAHELRTPLAGLQLYGDMLADGLGDPAKLRDYARRMSEEASRLGRVVSNVLGFSQLERGNLSVEVKSGPLGEVLRELAERAEPALDRAGATLALDVSPDLTARFDRDALIRIVGNLLDNAEKYGRDADDRTIELAARATADAVEVVVSDRGPGVTAQTRPKLFHPFSRGVTTDGPAGLGLGLALSQSLARAMGGDLEYRAPATGAAFVLRLPK